MSTKKDIHNIAFFIMDISKCGGTERVSTVLANEFTKRGYNVSIISCRNGENSIFEINSEVSLYSLHGENYSNSLVRKYRCSKNLYNMIHKNKIDLLVTVDVALYFYAFFCRHICNCIAWEQFTSEISISKLVKISRFLAARYADAVVVLSNQDKKNYIKKYEKIKKIVTIYNPITIKSIPLSSKKNRTIISVGRLEHEKGFDNLIDAWSILEEKYPDWSVNIFGEGSQREALETKIGMLGLKRIFLKGYTDRVEVELSNSEIYVLPSRYEGFGLALLEARMAGLPCVSFDCNYGPSEIIDSGINGVLVENQNIMALAEALECLMKDDNKRKQMGINAYSNLEKFEITKIVETWIELIENL